LITALIGTRHWNVSWASWVQSPPSYTI
jgi:hypothetical protein